MITNRICAKHKFKETNEVLGKIFSKKISKHLTFPFLTVLPFYTFVCLCFYFFWKCYFSCLIVCLSGMYFFCPVLMKSIFSCLFLHLFCLYNWCCFYLVTYKVVAQHWPWKPIPTFSFSALATKNLQILLYFILFFFYLISLYACQLQWPVWNIKNKVVFCFW